MNKKSLKLPSVKTFINESRRKYKINEEESQFGDEISKINDWFKEKYPDPAFQFDWDGSTLKIMDGDEKEVESKTREELSSEIDGFPAKANESADYDPAVIAADLIANVGAKAKPEAIEKDVNKYSVSGYKDNAALKNIVKTLGLDDKGMMTAGQFISSHPLNESRKINEASEDALKYINSALNKIETAINNIDALGLSVAIKKHKSDLSKEDIENLNSIISDLIKKIGIKSDAIDKLTI